MLMRMTNIQKSVGHLLALTALAATAACTTPRQSEQQPARQSEYRPNYVPPPPMPSYNNRAPAALEAEIADLWRGFPGRTGIAVRRIDGNWTIHHRGDQLFPQQSVSKLWVAMTLLDKVDRGQAALSDPIRISRDDLTLFHQPLAAEVEAQGAVTKTVYTLLDKSLTESDNTANDSLLRHAGGPDAVRDYISRMNLGAIRFGPGERLLQSRIAGMEWRQNLSAGRTFYSARANVPFETRQRALNAYLADPMDGASPIAIASALDRLARGELLSENSTRLLIATLKRTKSGPNRLKAGVPLDWEFLHKTGTGQILGAVSTGYNDVGIMIAPDSTRYAVVVMLADTTAPVADRMQFMQAITRAIAYHHRR